MRGGEEICPEYVHSGHESLPQAIDRHWFILRRRVAATTEKYII